MHFSPIGTRLGLHAGMHVKVLTEWTVDRINLMAAHVVRASLDVVTRLSRVTLATAERATDHIDRAGRASARAALAGGMLLDAVAERGAVLRDLCGVGK